MAGKQMGAQAIIIPPHYHEGLEEFRRLQGKLAAAMVAPAKPRGLEILDGKAALKIWEQSLRIRTRRLPALLRSFATSILASSRPPRRLTRQLALIPLEQEVNRLIALHRQLWLQPFASDFQEGQLLLARCIEKIVADLHDLCTFMISTLEVGGSGLASGATPCRWRPEIGCPAEMAEYKNWLKNMGQPSLVAGICAGFSCSVWGLIHRVEALDF